MPTPGRNAAFAIDQFDVSRYFHEFKFKGDSDMIDVTPFGSRRSNSLSGIQKSTLDLKGFWDGPVGQINRILADRFGIDPDVLTISAPDTFGYGKACILMPAVLIKYDLHAKIKDAIMIEAEFAARGAADDGFIINTPLTAITTTAIGTTLDNGTLAGATTKGCQAQMHVFSATGTTPTLAMKIQSSPDATTWTDLLTFTSATAATSQRLTLPTGTTIPQYLRVNYTTTGTTPSFTALVAISRGLF